MLAIFEIDRRKGTKMTQSIGSWAKAGVGALALGALSLAPDDGDAGSGSISIYSGLVCIARDYTGTISANTGTYQTVCNTGELAIAAFGTCPTNGYMIGTSLNLTQIGRDTWLKCSTSGTAHWQGTCCSGF